MRVSSRLLIGSSYFCALSTAHPFGQPLDFSHYASKRAGPSLVGYLGVFFLGDDPDVYFYLSNGNDATSFTVLNGGDPLLVPTLGTGGVRDPAIVTGGGSEAEHKWYIVGTDLDISKTTWDASERTGSRSIFIWESTNLVDWTNERLIQVEDDTAGMVWAPEALWDADQAQYLVHWASKFFDPSDTNHTGSPSAIQIRYAYTSDFHTFTSPGTYIDYSPTDVIDLDILPLGNNSYARFLKNETATNVFTEISTAGLFGTWTRPGGPHAIIQQDVEGPAAYWDNLVAGEAHLLLDYFDGDGYAPYQSADVLEAGSWSRSNASNFPGGLRHGSVLPVNQTLYDALGTL